MPPAVDWNHEKCLLLISKFKKREALWNRNAKEFHNPKKKEEEWFALAQEINAPQVEIKKKIECLRGSYRRERSKVRSSKELYCPKWFAYKFLDFLEETNNYNNLYSSPVSDDLEAVSVPGKISHPPEQNVPYSPKRNLEPLDNKEYTLALEAIDLFSKKLKCDTVDSSQKHELAKSKLKHTKELNLETTGTVSDSHETPSIPTSKDGAESPSELRREVLLQDEIQYDGFRNAPVISIVRNSIGTPATKSTSKLLRISKGSTRVSDRVRRDVSQNKTEFALKKRRMFRSGCSPYRLIRPKPKSKDTKTHQEPVKSSLKPSKKNSGRKIQPVVEVTSDNMDEDLQNSPGKMTELTIEDETGVLDMVGEKGSAVVTEIQNVGDCSQNENTVAEPYYMPNDTVLVRQSSKSVNDESTVFMSVNNVPLPRQEDDKLDECTSFGQLVESSLRKLSSLQRIKAKMKLSQVLWDLELEALNRNAE